MYSYESPKLLIFEPVPAKKIGTPCAVPATLLVNNLHNIWYNLVTFVWDITHAGMEKITDTNQSKALHYVHEIGAVVPVHLTI